MNHGEQFTIRRKVFKIFGGAFHIYDSNGRLVGYCKQKAFKLREDLRIHTDESCTETLLVISARNIIDFGATYDIGLPDGTALGSIKRMGIASTVLRDHWVLHDPEENQIGEILEDGQGLAFARRFVPLVSLLSPQVYHLTATGTEVPAVSYRTHMNLFVRRLGIRIEQDAPALDERLVLGIGCLLCAIESRDER
ncbi:MAG: hypothetical protein MK082_04565 [Phycisphaerales bacterium]|nr:hypothetical protein [Phycisphaerales bacterium]